MRISNSFRSVICGIAAAVALAALPVVSSAAVFVGVSVNIAPPVLPVYVQPPCPAVGFLWVPGYWAYGDAGYYWVPGTWVQPPSVGLLWTPGYWGWVNGAYAWNAGYWGPHVGFYGGVNYGFGYAGVGFAGGYWRGGAFFYNRAVANLGGIHVTNVYNRTVINNVSVTRVSFNGGPGGVIARPTRMELAAAHERHIAFTPMQRQHVQAAARNRSMLASQNGGRPAVAATMRPGQFAGRGAVAARTGGEPGRFGSEPAQHFNRPAPARFEGGGAQHFDRPQAQQFNRPQAPRYHEQAARPAQPRAEGRGARDEERDHR
jgi:WXXGXW repeat (2 copies)